MEHVLQCLVAGVIIIGGPLLTIFDLQGNTLMMLSSALALPFMMKCGIFIGSLCWPCLQFMSSASAWNFSFPSLA